MNSFLLRTRQKADDSGAENSSYKGNAQRQKHSEKKRRVDVASVGPTMCKGCIINADNAKLPTITQQGDYYLIV
jgi:hypothetical protein